VTVVPVDLLLSDTGSPPAVTPNAFLFWRDTMDYSTRQFLIEMNGALSPVLFLRSVAPRELDSGSFIDFSERIAMRISLISDFDRMCRVVPSIDHDRVELTVRYCIAACEDGRPTDALDWLSASANLVDDKQILSDAIENVLRGME
jgi:hypothetical protein